MKKDFKVDGMEVLSNREKSLMPRRSWFWCGYCDRDVVAPGGKCGFCGGRAEKRRLLK